MLVVLLTPVHVPCALYAPCSQVARRLLQTLRTRGLAVPDIGDVTRTFDTNVISPGTAFMVGRRAALHRWVATRGVIMHNTK